MYHVDPDALSFMVAILMSLVTTYVSIVKKVMSKKSKISKLWLSNEIMMCFLAFLIALEIYPHIAKLLPEFITKPVFAATCVHMSSRLVIYLEEKVSKVFGQTD